MIVEQRVVCPLLIGREAPLTAGFHALERARAGHGGTVLISGEAGIGKSRFLRALTEESRAQGFLSLQGACFEADRAHPYAPLLDLVRTLSATTSPALAAHAFAPASVELATLFPELRAVFTDVTPREALEPQEERRQLFHSFTEAIHALARVQPILLMIEDVHWSDEASLDLMLHLARRIGQASIALVLTFRSDEVGPRLARLLADLDRARCASEIGLRPLGTAEVTVMLQSIFGAEGALGAPFVNGLHELTEGNPFFIEEVLKSLLVAGDLTRTNHGWQARPLENVRVPRTATEAVGRRLADLSDEARRLASIAAVAGRRFDFGLLQAVTRHDDSDLLPLFKELIAAQLVVEESTDRFAFRHALTREAIRARLMARERAVLHRMIGVALEQLYDASTHDGDDAIAYHMFEAGEWEPARKYALRAASRALTLGAPREALEHFDRAVHATEQSGLRPDATLRVSRGRARETLGLFQLAHDDFTAALATARADGDQQAEWEALHALGLLWAARDYDLAGQYRREALDVARTVGDPARIARSLNRIGNWFVNREDPRSGIPHHNEALAIFEAHADRRGVCETVDLLAMALHIAGAEEAAVRQYERVIDLFSAEEDRRGLVNAFSVMSACGPSHHASAAPGRASRQTAELLRSERALRLATEIGWRAGEAFSSYLIADCLAWRGEFPRAIQLARESLAIALEIDHREWQCGAYRALGFIAQDLGDMPDAIRQLQTAYAIAQRLGSAVWIRWCGAPYAIALTRDGRLGDAARVLDEIDQVVGTSATAGEPWGNEQRTLGERHLALARLELLLAGGAPEEVLKLLGEYAVGDTPRVALLRAQALVALQRWGEATNALAVARESATSQEARPLLWRIEALCGEVHLGERRRLEARRAFDAARALAHQMVAGLDDRAAVATFQVSVDRLAPPPAVRTARQSAKAAHGGLTRRERETAALIAKGMPNRHIARSLGIGERTVEGHVASTLAKLGFASRAQIAVWAVEQGLTGADQPAGGSKR